MKPTKRAKWAVRNGKVRKKVVDPLTGRVVSVTAASEIEALARVRSIKEAADAVRFGQRSPEEARKIVAANVWGEVRLRDLWDRWLKARGKGSAWERQARATWANRIAPDLGKARVWELTAQRLEEWERGQLDQGLANKTVINAFELVRSMCRLAMRDGLIDRLPWADYRPERGVSREIEACVSVDELRLLVDAARERDEANWKKGRFSDLAVRVLVMALCGLRQGEAAGLGWDDCRIDEPPYVVMIRYQAIDGWQGIYPDWDRPMSPTKGRREAAIRVGAALVAALRAQRETLRRMGWWATNGPVFPTKGGGWRSHANTIKPETVRELARRAGLPNWERWRTHSLRHSFSTLELIASGGDLEAVRRRTRHADVKTLLQYVHPAARGTLPGSFIDRDEAPALPPATLPPALPAPGASGVPLLVAPSAADMDRTLAEAIEDASVVRAKTEEEREAARREWRRQYKAKGRQKIAPHMEIALALSDEDFALAATGTWRPREVTEDADRAYAARYAREMRASGDGDKARRAGLMARRAKLAAWGSTMKRAVTVRARRRSHEDVGIDLGI